MLIIAHAATPVIVVCRIIAPAAILPSEKKPFSPLFGRLCKFLVNSLPEAGRDVGSSEAFPEIFDAFLPVAQKWV